VILGIRLEWRTPARGQDAPDAGHYAEHQCARDDAGARVEYHERQVSKRVADRGPVGEPLEV
jgi:hypothetical protein